MWKHYYHQLPNCISEVFINNQILNLHKKDAYTFFLPYRRTYSGQRFITYNGIKLWNNEIPKNVRENNNLSFFLKSYKEFLCA